MLPVNSYVDLFVSIIAREPLDASRARVQARDHTGSTVVAIIPCVTIAQIPVDYFLCIRNVLISRELVRILCAACCFSHSQLCFYHMYLGDTGQNSLRAGHLRCVRFQARVWR